MPAEVSVVVAYCGDGVERDTKQRGFHSHLFTVVVDELLSCLEFLREMVEPLGLEGVINPFTVTERQAVLSNGRAIGVDHDVAIER